MSDKTLKQKNKESYEYNNSPSFVKKFIDDLAKVESTKEDLMNIILDCIEEKEKSQLRALKNWVDKNNSKGIEIKYLSLDSIVELLTTSEITPNELKLGMNQKSLKEFNT
jgi:hypothetical protein